MSEKKPTVRDRLIDLLASLTGSAIAVRIGLRSMQHGWIDLAAVVFTLAAWLIVCTAIETKRWD